eukprot:5957501-Amphidinium_carterae.1
MAVPENIDPQSITALVTFCFRALNVVNWVGACIKYFVGFLNIIKAAVMPIIKSFADCCPGTSRLMET